MNFNKLIQSILLIAAILGTVSLMSCSVFQKNTPATTEEVVSTPTTPPPPAPVVGKEIEHIVSISSASQCAKYSWKDRGLAPKAYTAGVALTFARAVCQPDRADVKLVSAARPLPESQWDATDSLSWYNSNFKALGMSNDTSGVDTLRHAYTLLLGLGMRESSGVYCEGRDMSADFSSASSAEAGLYQASWGVSRVSPILVTMFESYQTGQIECFLPTFSKNINSCSSTDWKNWGTGTGAAWQELTKKCPAFAVEYASVVIRKSGGTNGEFGPLRKKAAEIRPECDSMLLQVQKLVQENPNYCEALR